METIFKLFGGYLVFILILNVLFFGALAFFGFKACNYIESGKAASHIQQIQEPSQPVEQAP